MAAVVSCACLHRAARLHACVTGNLDDIAVASRNGNLSLDAGSAISEPIRLSCLDACLAQLQHGSLPCSLVASYGMHRHSMYPRLRVRSGHARVERGFLHTSVFGCLYLRKYVRNNIKSSIRL